jgi:hypothetical protein
MKFTSCIAVGLGLCVGEIISALGCSPSGDAPRADAESSLSDQVGRSTSAPTLRSSAGAREISARMPARSSPSAEQSGEERNKSKEPSQATDSPSPASAGSVADSRPASRGHQSYGQAGKGGGSDSDGTGDFSDGPPGELGSDSQDSTDGMFVPGGPDDTYGRPGSNGPPAGDWGGIQ